MKQIFSIISITVLLVSCGGGTSSSMEEVLNADVETVRDKRSEIESQLKELESQIAQLDSVIASKDDNAKLPLVTTLKVKEQLFQHYLELQGDVMTKQNVLIYPEMAGTLQRVYVKEGQRVKKGRILANIDDGGLGSQLAQMRTQLDLARTTFERQKRLWEQNIGSEIQYLQAKTQYEAQESAVAQMESQVAKSTIKAPFTGIIDDVVKDEGTVVAPGPGSEVFRIVNLSNMYVEVQVPESHLPTVTPGKKVEVFFPVLGEGVVTEIRQTGNFINPGNRSFSVEIPVPNKGGKVKPNLTAIAKINDYTNETAILIPQSVVSENATGDQYVYLTKPRDTGEGLVVKKSVIQLGKTQGDVVEVVSGLKAGDQIIVEGARSVRDGQAVQVLDSTKTANK